ncbi:unnamed protein product, partial [Didymodactylos carnosus]
QLKDQPHVLLFLRNISELQFNLDGLIDTFKMENNEIDGIKTIVRNNHILSKWIVKQTILDIPASICENLNSDLNIPEKLRWAQQTELFFAAKYNNKDVIQKLEKLESVLFAYIPTKISQYELSVLVNANFLTNVNREQIHTNSMWNQWLFSQIPIEMYRWIGEMAKEAKWHAYVYDLVPSKLNLTSDMLAI